MDALVPAFIAALIAQAGDRGPLLAAVLADRYARPRLVLAGFFFAHLIGFALAAFVGRLVAAALSPEGRALVLAMTLLLAAVGLIWRPGQLDRLTGWRIGAFATALIGGFILFFGDRSQFLALGIAASTGMPAFAAAGATLGAMVPIGAAIALGEDKWRALPHRPARYVAAALFAIIGIFIALGAWRLI